MDSTDNEDTTSTRYLQRRHSWSYKVVRDGPPGSPQAKALAKGNLQGVHCILEGHYAQAKVGAESSKSMSTKSVTSNKSKQSSIRMRVLQAVGHGITAVTAGSLDKEKLVAFRNALQAKGIDLSRWGRDGAKSVEQLFWEVYQQHGCIISGLGLESPVKLKRMTKLMKIQLTAEIEGVEHTLFSRLQFRHDGQQIERKQFPLNKLKWVVEPDMDLVLNDELLARDSPYTEDFRSSCVWVLKSRLGLSERWQAENLREDCELNTYHTEDDQESKGYPGLNTCYCIHMVTFRVIDPTKPQVQCLGLPQGQEFATAEGDFNFTGQQDDDGLPIGTQLNIWTWCRSVQTPSSPSREPEAIDEDKVRLIKRVPLPLAYLQHARTDRPQLYRDRSKPNQALLRALAGSKTDWDVARNIATSISSPDYALKTFIADIGLAFPELNLYLIGGHSTSGRTLGDEYQRTVGAFTAIYWMARMHLDGKEGFTFGVDDDWQVINPKRVSVDDHRLAPADKRHKFLEQNNWGYLQRLLVDAGLVTVEANGSLLPCADRFLALLALTAIHDIMKMEALLPTVQPEHAPYHSYAKGDTIVDHDYALSYIMDYYADQLPSFNGLSEESRQMLQFTQCSLSFNHGWFVQAEAPPGATFTKMREVLIRDWKSQIRRDDMAFYFVHWLTDLAGAEPTPLGGCEKFVMKFPLPVLNSFLRSFGIVEKIVDHTETEVMEEYLKTRWEEFTPSLGPLPVGNSAVAKLRLVCMAQANAPHVLQGWDGLSAEDKDLLSVEMSRSACIGQSFSEGICPPDVRSQLAGPAFLIYYGPAFLQNLTSDDSAELRLTMLAEVYRAARELWPATAAEATSHVIVRVDTIKSLTNKAIKDIPDNGQMWIIVKHNEHEAFIETSSTRKLNQFITKGQSIQVLDLCPDSRVCAQDNPEKSTQPTFAPAARRSSFMPMQTPA